MKDSISEAIVMAQGSGSSANVGPLGEFRMSLIKTVPLKGF